MTVDVEQLLCLGVHGFHELTYYRWNAVRAADATPVVCVHGLTRNGRDFDFLAERLAAKTTVYAPDIPGRGRSPWLPVKEDYGYPLYVADTAMLIARTGAKEIDYVGTSMGGIVGMMLASLPGSPIRKLVINDIGALVPKAGLERLRDYVGGPADFAGIEEAEAYFRRVLAPFGNLSDAQWRHLSVHGVQPKQDGRLQLSYDPTIARIFQGELQDADLWSFWDRITCPTLLIRGAESDILRADTAEEMTRRGPKATLLTIPGVGHAPSLMAEDHIAAIAAFLAE